MGKITPQEMSQRNADSMTTLSLYKSSKDSNGIYTVVDYKRKDGSLAKKSVLSSLSGQNYLVQTITYYKLDGTTTDLVEIFDLSYDTDGNVISEVKR